MQSQKKFGKLANTYFRLDFPFSIIGITETGITDEDLGGFIPGYFFEYVPTPLSAGGVGVYIRDDYDYFVTEKASEVPYQALNGLKLFLKRKIYFVVFCIGNMTTRIAS